jgi:predicted  nucleic acid-binding Zn-ribbon protein
MTTEISNSDDIIDSRDVIKKIEELESDLEDVEEEIETLKDEMREAETEDEEADLESQLEDKIAEADEIRDELKPLLDLQREAEGYCEWRDGAALIRDSYFKEYAEQYADDVGAINREAHWPNCHIDWEAAAEDLKSDFTSVDFEGVTYWIRS